MPESPVQDKKRNSQMVAIIIGIIVAAAVLFGGGAFLFTQLFSGHIKSPTEYQKTTLSPSSYASTLDCSGTIRAAKSSSVSPEVSGTISKVLVEDGDKVKKGQVLFKIKNSTITKTAKTNKESYEKAASSEQQAYASYKAASSSLNAAKERKQAAVEAAEKRQSELEEEQAEAEADGESEEDAESSAESGDDAVQVTVDSSYDEAISAAQSTLDSAKASYEAAKSNADNAQSAYKAALEQKELLTVKAGESGTVINLKAEKGMTTSNLNAQGAALQIADLDTLVAVVTVPEDSVASVSQGQDATITSKSLPDEEISATVSKVASTPNESDDSKDGDGTYNVTLTIGSSSKAKVGMSVNASIELQDFGTVYYVPSSAIQEKDGIPYVEIIYNDNTTEQHQVVVVGTADDGQKVIKGDTLAQGTTIRSDLSE